MNELLLAAASWLHLIATVAWIGGIGFILFIAMPSARQVMGTGAGKLMGEISKHFTPVANYSIILLVLTGAALAVLKYKVSNTAILESKWIIVLSAKHILVLAMIVIHFHRGLILTPRINMTESKTSKSSMQKQSLNLIRVNFGLGLILLLLSAIITSI